MKHIRLTGLLACFGLAMGGIAMAAPAMAATQCTGPSCSSTGSVSVTASITESIDATSFTFAPVSAGQQSGYRDNTGADYVGPYTSTPPPTYGALSQDFALTVSTGDAAGYVVTETATDFSSGSRSFPVAALGVYNISALTSGWAGPYALSNGSPTTVASRSAPSSGSGDIWAQNDSVQVPSSAGSGTYSSTITAIAIAQ